MTSCEYTTNEIRGSCTQRQLRSSLWECARDSKRTIAAAETIPSAVVSGACAYVHTQARPSPPHAASHPTLPVPPAFHPYNNSSCLVGHHFRHRLRPAPVQVKVCVASRVARPLDSGRWHPSPKFPPAGQSQWFPPTPVAVVHRQRVSPRTTAAAAAPRGRHFASRTDNVGSNFVFQKLSIRYRHMCRYRYFVN